MVESQLSSTLRDGACLLGESTADATNDLKSVLLRRLIQYAERVQWDNPHNESSSLEDIQSATAAQSLVVIERIQSILLAELENPDDANQVPVIGTRDLGQIRTLLSIAFNWGLHPLIASFTTGWPQGKLSGSSPTPDPALVRCYGSLKNFGTRVMGLLYPTGIEGPISRTLITSILLGSHLPHVLGSWLVLGWLPKSAECASMSTAHNLRQLTMRLLAFLSPAQTINMLGTVLSSPPSLPIYARKSGSGLMSRQLLRPEGVQGLCAAVFGEGEAQNEDPAPEKYEHVARVLTTLPLNIQPEEYYTIISPHVLELLSETAPPSFRRAAAFTISKVLGTDSSGTVGNKVFTSILHSPILNITSIHGTGVNETKSSVDARPSSAISRLLILLSNLDPAPHVISRLLSPIVPALYSLLAFLESVKTANPILKEGLTNMLVTWGKVMNPEEGQQVLWRVLSGERGEWQLNPEYGIVRVEKTDTLPQLDFLTPGDSEDVDVDSNILNLYPDPVHFVRFLKGVDRADISSELFVDLLERYREKRGDSPQDSVRTLLYLQIIVQMQNQLSKGNTTSNILSKPSHILQFIKHVLESTATRPVEPAPKSASPSIALRAPRIEELPDQDLSDGDSDDDAPGSQVLNPDDEMVETTINLLLSVLEANDDLSARTEPVLNDIFSFLDTISRTGPAEIQSLAREARIVMTARLASTSAPRRTRKEDSSEETYQRALKLLQDPILPVRAHGLMLLKGLVTPNTDKNSHPVDRALIPAILSIFLQSIQDDESYIFLNAVQGLAAMVDGFGQEVLVSLVKEYAQDTEGLGATSFTQHDVDVKLRIGEALGSTIRRCGSALSIYVDLIVPTLFQISRSSGLPTTIRTSSLSLLADCENASSLALLPYIQDLVNAMVDLLQVESVASKQTHSKTEKPTMDTEPTFAESKFPPLRRAAIRFLSLVVKDTTQALYDDFCDPSILPQPMVERAKTTLGYLTYADDDQMIRVMAREALEMFEHLQTAQLGL
ncbi:hypothetical protein BDN72DRAFT_891803 [Pluteus cervinus]|uniref:Uncharacterized protein n=1 Tax=Pluteus cervinus TaxID=181527 RepID=A0ACD3BC81_9AGAR|nr:hypothetical protein BDN72DRAFT_891803 [Pluteus cervinus]